MQLFAPAKLTLDLRVTGVRDDGLHFIESEMVLVDLCDVIHVPDPPSPRLNETRSKTQYPRESSMPSTVAIDYELVSCWARRPAPVIDGGPTNLVSRALALAGLSAEVRLTKRIPPGAGLGGGSSDAASILKWASYQDLVGASALGADVAFCLTATRARVSGIGEIVEPLPALQQTYTLLIPPIEVSTPAVYRRWDELGGPTGDCGNDLEPAALSAFPELRPYRDQLASATGMRPRMAGSGSTFFVEGAFPGGDHVVVRTLPGG